MATLFRRAVIKILDTFTRVFSIDWVTFSRIHKSASLEELGSKKGGWVIPTHLVNQDSICYCVGVGENITFDLELISRFNCNVYAYDPTPRAASHVLANANNISNYHFFPVGVWDKNEVLKFYVPVEVAHVSHSVLNLQKTEDYFEAPCKRLSNIMSENGHNSIDLLKLDIEGAEYRVLNSIIEDKLDIGVICVEYDEIYHSLNNKFLTRIKESVSHLIDYGYTIVAIEPTCQYIFVKNTLLDI